MPTPACDNDRMRLHNIASSAAVGTLLFLAPQIAAAATINVSITDSTYVQKNLTIQPGDTVVWTNNGTAPHTMTGDNGSFGSATLQPGQTYSQVFTAAGAYPYYCQFHGNKGGVGQSGVVTVAGAASNTNTVTTSTNTGTQTTLTAEQLKAQVQALINQITILQAQAGGAAAGTTIKTDSSACPLIGRSLRAGSSGDDVTRLQQFLARDSAIYPEAMVTGYYGALTEAAVKRWQVKYNIVSSGTADTTGYGVVGPRTAAAISLQCTSMSISGGGSSGGTATVGGYFQITPVTGNAPLSVTAQVTVNTVKSCAAATYTLDWGDGTVPQGILVPANSCNQLQQTYPHLYPFSGTYIVKLSSGSHQTSATIVVGGSSVIPSTSVVDSVSASPNSGLTPLTVTFTGTINQNSSCNGGIYTLQFGDGQTAVIPYPSDACRPVSFNVQHQYTTIGGFSARLLRGDTNGSQVAATQITVAGTSSSGAYPPPGLTPQVGGTVAVGFTLPGCPAFSLSWGDGLDTRSGTAASCTASGAGNTTTTLSHTYAQSGSYTITLIRGSQTDTMGTTVNN